LYVGHDESTAHIQTFVRQQSSSGAAAKAPQLRPSQSTSGGTMRGRGGARGMYGRGSVGGRGGGSMSRFGQRTVTRTNMLPTMSGFGGNTAQKASYSQQQPSISTQVCLQVNALTLTLVCSMPSRCYVQHRPFPLNLNHGQLFLSAPPRDLQLLALDSRRKPSTCACLR
jgi:hypothetical protein